MPYTLRPLALALLALPAAWPVLAETPATTTVANPSATTALPPVTVTAKGTAANTLETAAATLVVDADERFARGAQNLGELLRATPGLAVASDGAQGQNPVLRGMKKESVVLLVDGMRLNSAQPAGAIASFMSLDLAERIEVVKGPAAVRYGSGALGGVVNVLLPQARFVSQPEYLLSTSFDTASAGLRASGVVQAAAGDHAWMLGSSLAHSDDYRSPDGTVPRTGYASNSLIGQYRFRIDADQQLRVSLQQHEDRDVWYPGSSKPSANPLLRSTMVHSPEQSRQLAELGYQRQGRGETPLNVDVRVYRQAVERQVASWAEGLGRNNSFTEVSFVTDGIDARADWLVHPQHLISFGAQYWQMAASPERLLAGPAPAFALGRNDPFQDGQIEALGWHLQDDMRFGPLKVLAALRHDTVKGSAASINNGSVRQGLTRRDGAFSGHLGAIVEVAPLLHPYASVARGFRAGEMRERFESSPRGDGYYYLGNPQIRPETSTQVELGVKGRSERFHYALAAYQNRITDYISGRLTGTSLNGMPVKATENIGAVTIRGVEGDARWQFVRGQWAVLGVSRLRGTNDSLNEALFQMPADELSLGWQGQLQSGWSADLTGRFVRRQDRVATQFSRGTENATPGFVTADLGLTWRDARQQVRLALKNLADRRYHEHLSEGVSGSEIAAVGRSLQLGWQGRF